MLSNCKKRLHDYSLENDFNTINNLNEPTLWDIVVKNARPLCKVERAIKKPNRNSVIDASSTNTNPVDEDDIFETFSKIESTKSLMLTSSTDTVPTHNSLEDILNVDYSRTSTDIGSSLRIDKDGNLMLDEPSSSFNDNDNTKIMSLLEGRTIVSENCSDSQTVKPYRDAYKVTKGTRWSVEEEDKFYAAIEMFGLDLMMVRSLLPNFTSKQIRDKYRIEEKKNYHRLEEALKKRRPMSVSMFESIHGTIDASKHFKPFPLNSEGYNQNSCILSQPSHLQLISNDKEYGKQGFLMESSTVDNALGDLFDINLNTLSDDIFL